MKTQHLEQRLASVLLFLRVSVFLVMGIWVLDKFLNPGHASAVFETFYGVSGLGKAAFLALGSLQAIIVLAFLAGYEKTISYGLVLLMHLGSTLVSIPRYLDPFTGSNLLFFAAWPMLGALVALYLLREYDTLFTLKQSVKESELAEVTG